MGVQRTVAEEFVGGAVKAAGAGTGDDVDLPATGAAHVRRVAAGLYLELLHGVGRSAEVLCAECWIGISGPIEQEVVCVGATAANRDRRSLTWPPIQRIHVAGCSAVTRMRSRDSEYQVNEHAAVQGQGINGALVNHCSNAGILRLQEFARSLDLNGLRFVTDMQLQIERGLLAHLEIYRLRRVGKSRTVNTESVSAWLQSRDLVEPGRVRSDFSLCARTTGGEVNMRTRDRMVLWIQNGSAHDGEVALCVGCDEGCCEAENGEEESAEHGSP